VCCRLRRKVIEPCLLKFCHRRASPISTVLDEQNTPSGQRIVALPGAGKGRAREKIEGKNCRRKCGGFSMDRVDAARAVLGLLAGLLAPCPCAFQVEHVYHLISRAHG
jgi:hypothetical protein